MLPANYTITDKILRQIGTIEGAKEVINMAPIVPAWEKKFAEDALARTVYYGTAIEGNALSFDQAKEVLEGKQVVAKERDVQEILNYRDVMTFLGQLKSAHFNLNPNMPFMYTAEQMMRIQALTVHKIIESGIGQYRNDAVVVRSVRFGESSFKAPPPAEVSFLIDAFFQWFNTIEAQDIHPVLRAGIMHYSLVAIHPFIEGNGRTARAMANLVLHAEGYDIRHIFSLEEYFDRDIMTYYGALQAVSTQSANLQDRDYTPWLEYFTKVLAIELTRVKERVQNLSLDIKLKNKVGRQIALSERQVEMVQFMKDHEALHMRDAKELVSDVSDDTLLRDLKDLIDKGLVKKVGSTKAARYVLV